ncbi:Phosphoglycerate kinase [Candidatus Hepatincolaceae symbiont of Richtersius coronifer]
MANKFVTLEDLEVKGKKVLIRVDVNVPMKDGKITNDDRIVKSAPTIKELSDKKAKVIVISHLGRPAGKGYEEEFSLKPVALALEKAVGKKVAFAKDCIGEETKKLIDKMEDGEILMLENVRFYAEESKNDPKFTAKLAELGDLYISDAFSAAHRAHSSTEGLAHLLPHAAGRLMEAELKALEQALGNPKKPVLAIIGGAKISTKLDVLHNLVKKVDYIIVGGGMANTFLYAKGNDIGKSLCEKNMKDECLKIIEEAKRHNCTLVLPVDARIALTLEKNVTTKNIMHGSLPEGYEIFDSGDQSIESFINLIKNVKTLIWNGPLGVFEVTPFDTATFSLAKAAAALTKEGKLVTIAGGGDTVSALQIAGVYNDFTYVSTAGGAFLEWMEGKQLPGVICLEKDDNKKDKQGTK